MDRRHARPDGPSAPGPLTLRSAPDRLAVETDRLSVHHPPPVPPPRTVALVLQCLDVFPEVVATTAPSAADLRRWAEQDARPATAGARPGTADHDPDAVPVVVVAGATWASYLGEHPGPTPPGRGVVVVCADPASPVGEPVGWDGLHTVEVRARSEIVGAVCESLAGQALTAVTVRVDPEDADAP